jgi:hypothetical protein
LGTHPGVAIGADVAGVAIEASTARTAAIIVGLAALLLPFLVVAMRGRALFVIAYRVTGAWEVTLKALNAFPLEAHAGLCHGARLPIEHRRIHRLSGLTAVRDAARAVVVDVAGFGEFHQVALAVAPPLLTISRALRRDLAERFEIKAAGPVHTRRFSAAIIAGLFAIRRGDARAGVTTRRAP